MLKSMKEGIEFDLVKKYLEMEEIVFQKGSTEDENIKNIISFKDPISNLHIAIAQQSDHRIDVISSVKLSDDHFSIYSSMDEMSKSKLLKDLFMWATPRKPLLMMNFRNGDQKTLEGFTVVSPLYFDAFGMNALMENITLVAKSSKLMVSILRSHLEKVVK